MFLVIHYKHNHWIVLNAPRLSWHSAGTSKYSSLKRSNCTYNMSSCKNKCFYKRSPSCKKHTYASRGYNLCPSTGSNDYCTFDYILFCHTVNRAKAAQVSYFTQLWKMKKAQGNSTGYLWILLLFSCQLNDCLYAYSSQHLKWIEKSSIVLGRLWWKFLIHFKSWLLYIYI